MENKTYFDELSRVLKKHDIESGPVENGRLIIKMDGQSVGRIEKGAIRCLAPDDLRTAEASEAFQKAMPYAEMVAEYIDGLKRAPLLQADGLEDNFRLLADFNGTVLAGKEMSEGYEMQFVTWDWSYDRSGVEQGHYYHDNYESEKADFAVRSSKSSALFYRATNPCHNSVCKPLRNLKSDSKRPIFSTKKRGAICCVAPSDLQIEVAFYKAVPYAEMVADG